SGTKASMAPVVPSPAALRLPGLGYMCLRGAGAVSYTHLDVYKRQLLIRVKRLSHVISAHIALPVNRLRYAWHGAGSAQGAASRRRPLYPRAPASKIAATRSLRLIPAGFGSGRGSVRAKHGPQPASMRAAPAFRERLSDFEAVSTGSFSNNGE
ncbi:hypothetical protein AZZ77_004620, partial [Klebsiella pneumoniae]